MVYTCPNTHCVCIQFQMCFPMSFHTGAVNVNVILVQYSICGISLYCVVKSNVPSNFLKSMCAQSLLCALFTSTHLYLVRHVWNNMCKSILKRKMYVCSKFSCVRSSHNLCARTQLRRNIDQEPLEWVEVLSEFTISIASYKKGCRYVGCKEETRMKSNNRWRVNGKTPRYGRQRGKGDGHQHGGSPGYLSQSHLVRNWRDIGHQQAVGPRIYKTNYS